MCVLEIRLRQVVAGFHRVDSVDALLRDVGAGADLDAAQTVVAKVLGGPGYGGHGGCGDGDAEDGEEES